MSLHDAIHISAGRYSVTSKPEDFLSMLKSHGYIVIPSNPSDEIQDAILDELIDWMPYSEASSAARQARTAVMETLHDLA